MYSQLLLYRTRLYPEFAHIPDWGFAVPRRNSSQYVSYSPVIRMYRNSCIPDSKSQSQSKPVRYNVRAIDCMYKEHGKTQRRISLSGFSIRISAFSELVAKTDCFRFDIKLPRNPRNNLLADHIDMELLYRTYKLLSAVQFTESVRKTEFM